MANFKVKITEILEREIKISAKDEDEAIDKAEEQYRNGDIVLDSEDHKNTSYEVKQ